MGRLTAFLTAPTTGPLSAPVRRVFARSPIAQAIVAAFTPATQFSTGQLGAWYDPSDYTALFQDSAGTTPVTGVTQPVGRMLDKSGRSNTLSQATASARPLTSARVNLLTNTEQLDDAVWIKQAGVTVTANQAVAPDSTTTADLLVGNDTATGIYIVASGLPVVTNTKSVYLRAVSGAATVSIKDPVSTVGTAVCNLTTTWQRFSLSETNNTGAGLWIFNLPSAGIYAWGGQLEIGAAPTRYQRVNTSADYDAVGFTKYDTFDGIDDGLATGPMTFTANMDFFIAMRRNSAASVLIASPTPSASTYFGVIQAGSAAAADQFSGTPTYAANGVSLNGGAVGTTRGQIDTAVPISTWVVLEVRNLNLTDAAWTAFSIGNYGGFQINGDVGGIILCPAGDATARQKNRQYLGAKVGLTLP